MSAETIVPTMILSEDFSELKELGRTPQTLLESRTIKRAAFSLRMLEWSSRTEQTDTQLMDITARPTAPMEHLMATPPMDMQMERMDMLMVMKMGPGVQLQMENRQQMV